MLVPACMGYAPFVLPREALESRDTVHRICSAPLILAFTGRQFEFTLSCRICFVESTESVSDPESFSTKIRYGRSDPQPRSMEYEVVQRGRESTYSRLGGTHKILGQVPGVVLPLDTTPRCVAPIILLSQSLFQQLTLQRFVLDRFSTLG